MSNLKYVNLHDNFCHSSPWVAFCAVIKYCLVTDLTLVISFGVSGVKQYADELVNSLQHNTTLKSLTICCIETNELDLIKNVLIDTKCSVNKLNISTIPISLEEISLNNREVF